jgi:hypothetical protein
VDDAALSELMMEMLGKSRQPRSAEVLLEIGHAKIAKAGETIWASLQASKSVI